LGVNGGSRAVGRSTVDPGQFVVGPPGVPEFCEGSSTGPGGFAGHLGVRASEHTPAPFCSGMDLLNEYGSSDSERAGAPASNAVPAASPPGSPSTRLGAQTLVQFALGTAHQAAAQHQPRPRLVVPPAGASSASTATTHMRDAPRDESQLLDPPPPASTWTWQPDVITADGANAGPNAIRAVCLESDPEYDPLRVHCHVHLKRDVHQNKHDLFKNSCADTTAVKDCSNATTSMIEQVKSNSGFRV
jgi:hypothetical protein